MKKIYVLLFFLLFFFLPSSVFADEGWDIQNFKSNIVLQNDGSMQVAETIDVNFNSLQKHGIFRDIPIAYSTKTSQNRYLDVSNISVQENNSSANFTQSSNGNYLELKIGDGDRTVSGLQYYTISYSVRGMLDSYLDHDELYWNITGNSWPVPIEKASAKVSLPSDGITEATCYQGAYGAKEKCDSWLPDKAHALFQTTRMLSANEGLSIVTGYSKGLFPIAIISSPPTPQSQQTLANTYEVFSKTDMIIFLISAGLGVIFIFLLWYKKGRDPGIPNGEAVVVEYEPPENLRPAEMGTLIDQRADTLDVTASIIDLAAKGYLTITEKDKTWIFGSKDYIFTKSDKNTAGLLFYESELLSRLFALGTIINMSDLKYTFYKDLHDVEDSLYRDVVDKKLFSGNPKNVRTEYIFTGILLMVFSACVFIFVISGLYFWHPVLGISMGTFLTGFLLLFLSFAMPRRTMYGKEIYQRVLGYKLFISEVEKYKQQFFEKENMFNTILPYAIVFGLTEKFAQAMKDLGIQTQPSWYYGSRPFNILYFNSSMQSFSQSMSIAISSAPRGSGFSSGGGFSGGGFGGGGGGNW